MFKTYWIVVIMAILAVFFVGAAGQVEEDVLLVGVQGPFTGPNALHGEHLKNAITLAANEINAGGGIDGKQVVLKFEDDRADPKEAALVAEKFATTKNLFCVLGPVQSACAMAAMPVYEREGIVLMSGNNTLPKLTEMGYKHYFRIVPNSNQSGKFVAQILLGNDKMTAAVMYDMQEWAMGVHDAFKAEFLNLGGTIITEEGVRGGVDKEFTPVITKIASLEPDGFVMILEYHDAALVLRQAYALGYRAPLFAGPQTLLDASIAEMAGPEAVEGLIIAAYFYPYNPAPLCVSYTKRFQDLYGLVPNEQSAFGYDLLYVLKQAVEKWGGKTRADLVTALEKVEYEGVTGVTKFDKNHDQVVKKAAMLIMKNGKYQPYVFSE